MPKNKISKTNEKLAFSNSNKLKTIYETFKYALPHIYVLGDTMANMTLSIPDKIHKEMKNFSEVRWSEVARKAIINKLETLVLVEKIAQKSRLTSKDVEFFSKRINAAATKRFLDDNT